MNTAGKSIQDKMNSALYIAKALIQIPLAGVTSGLITGVTSGIMGAVATYNIPYGLAVGIGNGVKAGLAASINSLISHIPPAKAVQNARVSLMLRSIRRLVHTSLLGYKLEIGFVTTPKSNVLYIEAKEDGLHYQVRDTWDPRHYATCKLLNPTELPIEENTYYIYIPDEDHLESQIYFLDNNKKLHKLPGFTQLVKYAKSHITYGEPLTIEQLDAITTITGHVIFHTGVISYESINKTQHSDFTNFLPEILHFTEQNKHTSPTIPLNSLIKAELADINPDETLQPFANLDGAQQVIEFKKFFNALYDFELCFRAFERGIAIDYLEMRKRAYDAGHVLTNTIVNKLLPLQPFIEEVYEIMLSVLLASESINSSNTLIVAEKLTPIVAELSKQMNPDFLQPGRISLIKSIPTLHNYFLQWTQLLYSWEDSPNNVTSSPAENILRMRENTNKIINALKECRVNNQVQQFVQLTTFYINLKDAFINIKEILELSSKPLTDHSKAFIFTLLEILKYEYCITIITSIDHLEQETLLEPGSLSAPFLQKARNMYESITNILQAIINFTGDQYNYEHLLKLEDSMFLKLRLDKIRDRQETQEISKLQGLIDEPSYVFAATLDNQLQENILKTAKIYVFPYQAQKPSVTKNEIIPQYIKSVKICMEYFQAIKSCKYLLANIDTLQEKKFTHALHYSFIQKFIYEELPKTEASTFDKLMIKMVSFDAKYDVTTLYFVENNNQMTLNNMYFYNVNTNGLFYKDPEQSNPIQLSVSASLKQKLKTYQDKQLTSVPLSGQELHELITMHTKLYTTIIQPTEIQQKINLILQQIESKATTKIEILKQLKSQIPTLAPNHNSVSQNAKKYSLSNLQTKINQIQDWFEEHKKMLSPLIQHQLATANSQGEPFPNIEANEEPQLKSFKILTNTLYYAKKCSILLKNIYDHTYFCAETYIFFGLINSYLHIFPLVKNIKLLKNDPYYNNVYTMFHDDIQKIHETTYEPYVTPYTRSQESVLSDRTPITNSGLWYLVNFLELINNHLTVNLKDIDLQKLQLNAKTNLIALDHLITNNLLTNLMNPWESIIVVEDLIQKFKQALRTLQQTITGQKLIELLNTKVFIPLLMYFDHLEDQLGLKPGLIVELVQTFTDELYRGLAYALIDDPVVRYDILCNAEAINHRLRATQPQPTDSTYIKSVKTQRESYLIECKSAQNQWSMSSLHQDQITRIYKENLKDAPESCHDLEKHHLKDCIRKFRSFIGSESELKDAILKFQKDLVLKKYISVVLEVIQKFHPLENTNEIKELYSILCGNLESNSSMEDKIKYLCIFNKTYDKLSIQQHKVLKLDLPLLVSSAPKRNSSSSSANAAQEEQQLSRFAIT